MQQYSVDHIVEVLKGKCEVIGDSRHTFSNAKPISEADGSSLVWIAPGRADKLQLAKLTKANILLCDASFKDVASELPGKCLLIVSDPRLSFIRIMDASFSSRPAWGIHPSAIIHSAASIHPETYVGPYVVIGDRCSVGKGTILYGSVFIYDNVTIGEHVIIHAGTVVGADGFGFQRNESRELEKFPHIGGVVIEDNVEIGSNCCVDRAALGNTRIGRGTKIDNGSHIAHNVTIGEHSVITAHVEISGSATIGHHTWVGPNTCVRDGVKIGNKVTVGIGTVVTKDVPDNETWSGNPARKLLYPNQ